MSDDEILVLTGPEVLWCLQGRELEIVDVVSRAYLAHGGGRSSLPHSSFLRFPAKPANRIIALPAFLGDGFDLAGVKWISSFPGNLERGLDRASAAMILNRTDTGRPVAMIEGSVVSAKRTAASAALAALQLGGGAPPTRLAPNRLAIIGCGLINFEIARFLAAVYGRLPAVAVFDLDAQRARVFRDRLATLGAESESAASIEEALAGSSLVSFATTAGTPHVESLASLPEGATVLHVSLRDLAPEAILAADNVVDDVDHALREGTSLHLAEQRAGHRRFVRSTLAEILAGVKPPRRPEGGPAVFSPFGLGILDLAVGQLALERARQAGLGRRVEDFAPPRWTEWA